MAQRDRTQGFGFVYVNLADIINDRKCHSPQEKPREKSNPPNPVYNFNKDPISQEVSAFEHERSAAISQVKENLDRLQSLHHKLHAMLEELNQITQHDRKRRT